MLYTTSKLDLYTGFKDDLGEVAKSDPGLDVYVTTELFRGYRLTSIKSAFILAGEGDSTIFYAGPGGYWYAAVSWAFRDA